MLSGGAGHDHLLGGAGRDVLDGGAGVDTASYWFEPLIVVNLAAGVAPDAVASIESVDGTVGDDVIAADGKANGRSRRVPARALLGVVWRGRPRQWLRRARDAVRGRAGARPSPGCVQRGACG
jgi:hypothetical protein